MEIPDDAKISVSFNKNRWLEEERKKNWRDLLQPNDPRFNAVWGKKVKENEKKLNDKADKAKEEWEKRKNNKK